MSDLSYNSCCFVEFSSGVRYCAFEVSSAGDFDAKVFVLVDDRNAPDVCFVPQFA